MVLTVNIVLLSGVWLCVGVIIVALLPCHSPAGVGDLNLVTEKTNLLEIVDSFH